jgi:excisionase family DNA binding protein
MRQHSSNAATPEPPAETEVTPQPARQPDPRDARHAVVGLREPQPIVRPSAIETSWMAPRQAAAYLGVGVDTIYEACATDALKHVKLGYRTIRVRREWIDDWAERLARPAASQERHDVTDASE